MKNKKGFTIVELVIVIAVIAILAAVLIPTFSGVISKANQSSALQTARSTLTNALNMSSIAKLAGQKTNGGYQTMIVTEGHAFGYTGNELKQIDYPSSTSTVFKSILSDENNSTNSSNCFNSIIVAAANVSMTYTSATPNATALDGTLTLVDGTKYTLEQVTPGNEVELTISDDVIAILKIWASSNKLGCTEFSDITVKVEGGKYFVYIPGQAAVLYADVAEYNSANSTSLSADEFDALTTEQKTKTPATTASKVAELFVNGDFSKKVVVFTTFG